MKKRIISVLLIMCLILSMSVSTGFADGGTHIAGLTVTKVDDAKLSISCDMAPSGSTAKIQAVQTFIVAYDTSIFVPLLKNENKISGITTTPTAKAMAYEIYEDPETAETWDTKVYVYQNGNGSTGFLIIQPANGTGSELTSKVSLAKVYLGFQDGKGIADVSARAVRFATSSELTGASEDKAVKVNTGTETLTWSNGGSGDTLTTIPTVTASGFTFAKTPITETLVPVTDLSGKTYSAAVQEPAFGGTLTKDTDYTVSYAVKEGANGELKEGKPCGAGTYVVTVAGKGEYGSSFTKEFVIGKKSVMITPNSGQTKTYGDTDPELTYTTDLTGASDLETAFNEAVTGKLAYTGTDVGEYDITLGNLSAGNNFELTLRSTPVKFKITTKDVTETRAAVEQNVVLKVGDFTEPVFEDITGDLAYNYDGETTYAGVKGKLAALDKGATGTINYTYTAKGNYTGTITGAINFKIVDIEFKVGEDEATAANAINALTSDTTYGKTWSERIAVKSDAIVAKVGDNTKTGTYTIVPESGSVTDRPGVGTQNYTVTFTGSGYTNVKVFEGQITVTAKVLKSNNLEYTGTPITKEYDGDTTCALTTVSVKEGVLASGDTLTVNGTAVYDSADAGSRTVTFTPEAITSGNYTLAADQTLVIAATITKKDVVISAATVDDKDYDGNDDATVNTVTINGVSGALTNSDYTVTSAKFPDADADEAKVAVTINVELKGGAAGNYNLTNGTGYVVTAAAKINKVNNPTYGTTQTDTTYAIRTVAGEKTYTLSCSDLKGVTYTVTGKTTNNIVDTAEPTVSGNTLTYTSKECATAGPQDTITVKIGSTNYNDITLTLTVEASNKETVTIEGLTDNASFTYDGTAKKPEGEITVTGEKVAANELEVKYEGTGLTTYNDTVAPKNAGTYKVTYKVADSNPYYTGSVSYNFTIAKKAVTVAPKNFTITKGSDIPTFELAYTGLVSGDTLTPNDTAAFTCFEAGGVTPVSKATTAGTYTITWTNIGEITFTGADNYEVNKTATGTLTIKNPSSGGIISSVQKPTIEAGEGVKVTLSTDGTVATITVEAGYDLADVVLNGTSKGKVTEVKGLKTGDKLVVTATKKAAEPTDPTDEAILATLADQKLVARSKVVTMKNGKKAVRITWYNANGEMMEFDGVQIYRSTKKNSGYGKKPIFTSETDKYYNTAIKAGTKYYYKVRGFVVIDGQKYYTDWSLKAWRTVK